MGWFILGVFVGSTLGILVVGIASAAGSPDVEVEWVRAVNNQLEEELASARNDLTRLKEDLKFANSQLRRFEAR